MFLPTGHADLLVLSWHNICQHPFPVTLSLCLWTPTTDSSRCYCLLFLDLFHSVTQRLTLCPAPFICSPHFTWFLYTSTHFADRGLMLQGRSTAWFQSSWGLPLYRGTVQCLRRVMKASCIIHLCVQWPQPGLWLQSHQTFLSVAITNYWRANFSKAGPKSNSSLWQFQLQGLHMHMYSNCGRKRHLRQNKWDHFSGGDYKSYRLERSNLADTWHMHRAHRA